MKVFLAVVVDLATFVREFIFGHNIQLEQAQFPYIEKLEKMKAFVSSGSETVGVNLAAEPDRLVVPKRITPLIATGLESLGYVCVRQAKVMTRPVWALDTVEKVIYYGDTLSIINYEGRFAHVQHKDGAGWVLKDHLTTDFLAVYPDLNSEVIYLANDKQTKKLRHLIQDEFFASDLYLPLQAVEYVYFKLYLKNIEPSWTNERPRLPGLWQQLLKGRIGVNITISPKTGSVIEYFLPDGEGRIGYVLEVHPDESLLVESVGWEEEGRFMSQEFDKITWQAWRPIFIQFS